MDLVKLSEDSWQLLNRLTDRLPPEKVETYRSYSEVGEWDMLIDVLCASLIKHAIPVTPDEYDMLAGLLAMYDEPVEFYDHISHRERTLAALTLTD